MAFFELSGLTGVSGVVRNGSRRWKGGQGSEVTKGGMFCCGKNENKTVPRLSRKEMSVKEVGEEQVISIKMENGPG